MQIHIDTDELVKLAKEADDIFVTASAEDGLLRLLEIQETVNQAVEETKANLEKAALALNKDFQSIRSERIKVSYRAFGSKYQLDEAFIEELPAELVDKRIKYSLNNQGLKAYIKSNRKLPMGITPTDRRKKIVIGRVNAK